MTKITHLQERFAPAEKTGQFSWALDAGIIVTAAVCVVVTTVAVGVSMHASKHVAPVMMTFTDQRDATEVEARSGPTGAPLLWVAKDGDSTVYLFGSVHLLPQGTDWMDQRLFAAFDSANQVWFETQNLDRLPAIGDKHLKAGADQALFHRAQVMGKRVGGFEANRSTSGRLGTGFSDDGVNVTVEAWRSGDQKTMTEQVKARAAADPEIYRLLLSDRNKTWLPRIEAMMQEPGTSFVTLGAAHMVGSDGIVAQLRRNGVTVTRMDAAG